MKDKRFQKVTGQAELGVEKWAARHKETEKRNIAKVLDAFRKREINYQHFQLTSGYGLGDRGRDTLERLWADILGAEEALIRQQIVSGTHSISLALFGCLLPGNHMVIMGEPYDTLFKVIGRSKSDPGSLLELGIPYSIHPLEEWENMETSFTEQTKFLYIQRSKGYCYRKALALWEIEAMIKKAKSINPDIIAFVDNCYGEFTEDREPIEVGADLIAGSLIKNPGGSIAPSGGYLAGRGVLIERASYRLSAPGIGRELGPSLISNSYLYQGIFMAPHIVAEALKGAVYAAGAFDALGYDVLPGPEDLRSDIVQAISFHDPDKLKNFCRGVQKYSPVDSHVFLEDWEMAGYEDRVIMASGGFVQGSSIELSVDGPMRPPYNAYLQGGTSFSYIQLVIDRIIGEMLGIE